MFWSIAFLMLAHYVLYPLVLGTLSLLRGRPPRRESRLPKVSLIIAALNEEKVIRDKLLNSLALAYPADSLEILVVCDGSQDRTPEIVEEFGGRVQCLFERPRGGKARAISRAAAQATGEILVFSDANTYFRADALRKLVRNFASASVGGVTGRKAVRQGERQSAAGDRLYWNVESLVKSWQSRLGSVSVGDGEIFAVRRKLFAPLAMDTINDDASITMHLIRSGHRVLYEPEAVAEEEASLSLEDDFRVKARMVYGGYQTLQREADLLLWPVSAFSVQYFFHKQLRHLMPVLLLGLFFANLALLGNKPTDGLYRATLLGQVAFYLAAAIGEWLRRRGRPPGLLYLPLYYCWMNAAALQGLFYFLRRADGIAIWKRAAR